MIIGVPKEIKNNENRVALTPVGVSQLISNGHRVLVETGAALEADLKMKPMSQQERKSLLIRNRSGTPKWS